MALMDQSETSWWCLDVEKALYGCGLEGKHNLRRTKSSKNLELKVLLVLQFSSLENPTLCLAGSPSEATSETWIQLMFLGLRKCFIYEEI